MISDANQQIHYFKPAAEFLDMANLQKRVTAAIEVFVRGFSAGLSLTHPYECVRIDDVWVMRDAPRRNPRYYRKEEWIAYGVEPAMVDSVARRNTRGRFFVCDIQETDASAEMARTEYKQLGYRLLRTEPFFVHDLKRIPRLKSTVKIVRVKSQEMAERFGKVTRTRPIPRELLKEPMPFRQYVAIDGQSIVGWVRSIHAAKSAWCSNMYVVPSHRRRGIGSSMLAKMLRDDRTRGVKNSVLLSSHTGALLYPKVGYEQIGTLLLFGPKK
jgi:GNAT superfamily N-acetyltransferase